MFFSFFQALRMNRTLLSLNLGSNLIGDSGASKLAEVRNEIFLVTGNKLVSFVQQNNKHDVLTQVKRRDQTRKPNVVKSKQCHPKARKVQVSPLSAIFMKFGILSPIFGMYILYFSILKYTLLYKNVVFQPKLNFLIFLSILGLKYSCIVLKLQVMTFLFQNCIGLSVTIVFGV